MAPSFKIDLERRLGWSVEEFAVLSSLSPATVWKLLQEGKLASVKVGGRRIIPRDAGLKLLQLAE
ncbi:helix-turn-helix domain-containing protein [Bradyrhizobium sp. DASA03120]|uniref:helix-turn-helix domain-containing protein n=1 Tax=Bradyrhizobium sp. SMVTL-02 TaxID=3395917 RepID=UPI003F6E8E9D